MKQLILVTACIAGLSAFAQEVTVESSAELINTLPDKPWTEALGNDNTGYYLLRKHGDVSNQKVLVEKYGPDFKPLFTTDVGVSTGDFNEFTMHRLTKFVNGRVLVFLEGWSKSKGQNSFWVKELGADGTLPTEAILLETEPSTGQMKSANYRISFSPDGTKMLVLTEKPFAKGGKEEQRLQVFSTADWKSIWKEDIILESESDRSPNNEIVLDNSGTAYLYKDIKVSMKEHIYELYVRNGSSVKKQLIDLQTYFPAYHKLMADPNGGVIIGGMLSNQGGSATNWLATWQLRANASGELLVNKVEPLGQAMLSLVLSPNQASREGAKLEYFVLKDILLQPSGGLIMLAENYRSTSTPVGTAMPPVYDYELTFGGIMMIATNPNGERKWFTYYDKKQVLKTRHSDSHFGSFAYRLKGEDLVIAWNFTELLNDFPVHNFRYWIDRNGEKINIDNLYGKEAIYPTLLTVVKSDGTMQYADRTFNALPLATIQQPNAFPMAADANLFFETEKGLVLVSRMGGTDVKRYKFSTIKL